MLIGTRRNSKPAVIGQVDDPSRPVIGRPGNRRKDSLVTNEGERARYVRNLQGVPDGARDETALLLGQLLEAQSFHIILEWQIFPEWHQVQFIVDRHHAAVVIDDID